MAPKPGQTGFQGRVGNQYVGPQMWDPRGFYVVPDYGVKGQNLHVYPDGRKVLVKTPGGAAGAAAGAPGQPAGASAAPGAPAAPPDAQYLADLNRLGQQRTTSLAALAQQRAGGLNEYGYTPDLKFDPNNPYSKAALLKQSYDTQRRSSAQSMGAAGQLYGGAFQNQQDLANRNQAQAQDQLHRALQGFLTRNTTATEQAGTDYATGAMTAEGNRVGRIPTNPLYDPQPQAKTPAPTATPAPAAKPAAWTGRATKTVGAKRYYQGQSGKWIPY